MNHHAWFMWFRDQKQGFLLAKQVLHSLGKSPEDQGILILIRLLRKSLHK